MISEYDLSFGYEYKLFESLKIRFVKTPGKISSLHGFASNTTVPVGYAYEGHVIGLLTQSPSGQIF